MKSFLNATAVALAAIVLAGTSPAGADESSDEPPLQARTKELLRSFSSATTRDVQTDLRAALLAKADTLEAAGDDVLASHCLERAGILSYRFAEYGSARDIWTRGLAAARRSGDKQRVAALLNAQAVGVSVTGDDEAAVELQLELVELRRELGDVRGEGISWHNLGYSYYALFRFPETIEALSNALRLHREAGNAFGIAGSMGTLANALFEVGRMRDAIAMADSAVARARDLGDPSVLGSALQARARQLHYAGRLDESLADYDEAHDVLTTAGIVRVAAVSDVNRANALVTMQRYDEAGTVVDAAIERLVPVGSAAERVWADCVAARVAARSGHDGARARLAATIDRLESVRDSIPDELSRADAFRMAGGAYTELAMLEIDDERFEDAWRVIESGTARLLRDQLGLGDTDTLARLQGALAGMGAIALQFGVATADRNVVFLLEPDRVTAATIRIPPGFRDDAAAALRLMSSGAGDAECQPVLERLAEVVLGPVASRLAGADRIVVFPGDLSGFPFEALPVPGEENATIGSRFAVTYAPSATTFLHLQERGGRDGAVVVFADPALGDVTGERPQLAMRSARMSLTRLPEARAEGVAVGRSGTLLTGEDATRDAFLAQAPAAAVVHVAAHAVVDGVYPDHSGIVLAGDGGDMLTVGELRGVTLDADLVTLSGCETAGGYNATGEGAFGLTRAFLTAGARSVVSSWWDVEDAAARRFMELYYEALRDGTDRDVALQRARSTMRAEGFVLRDRTAFALAGATATPVDALVHASSVPVTSGAAVVVVIIALATALRRRRSARGA